MQKHLSQHVRDLMRKARESPEFRFSAAPVVAKPKKLIPVVKDARSSPASKTAKDVKIKVKLPPVKKTATPKVKLASPKKKDAVATRSAAVSSKALKLKIKEEVCYLFN